MQKSSIEQKIVTVTTGLTYIDESSTKSVPAFVAYVEETDTVPFCCYQVTSDKARYAKSGAAGWESSASLYVVAAREAEAAAIKDSVLDAFENARSATFVAFVESVTNAYEDGCWMYKIDYNFITL